MYKRQVEVFACGPHPMLAAVAALAREFALPCQVSLEEFMLSLIHISEPTRPY